MFAGDEWGRTRNKPRRARCAVKRSSDAIKAMQSQVHQALQWVEQNQQAAQAAAMGATQAY